MDKVKNDSKCRRQEEKEKRTSASGAKISYPTSPFILDTSQAILSLPTITGRQINLSNRLVILLPRISDPEIGDII